MAHFFTVGEIITAAKVQADMEAVGDEEAFITDAQWKEWMHSAMGKHHLEAVNSGMRYFETNLAIAGSELDDDGYGGGSIDLPDDYFVHVGCDRQESNRWVNMFELMSQERNYTTGTSLNRPIAFAVIGQKLHIYPKPPASTQLRFIYIPQAPKIRGAADAFRVDLITPDGEEFIIWSLVVRALAKEESDTADARMERSAALEALREWLVNRAIQSPRRRQVEADPMSTPYGDSRWDAGSYRY